MTKGKPRDITGERNGRIEALHLDRREGGISYWRVRCDCGKEYCVRLGNFFRTYQCSSCQSKEAGKISKKHGISGTPLYRFWRSNNSNFCEQWRNDPILFGKESDFDSRKPRTVLVPIDDSLPIGPGNFRWRPVAIKGVHTVGDFSGNYSEWADRLGVSGERIRQLMNLLDHDMSKVVARLSIPAKERVREGIQRMQANSRERRLNNQKLRRNRNRGKEHLIQMLLSGGITVYSENPKPEITRMAHQARKLGLATKLVKGEGYIHLCTVRIPCTSP